MDIDNVVVEHSAIIAGAMEFSVGIRHNAYQEFVAPLQS